MVGLALAPVLARYGAVGLQAQPHCRPGRPQAIAGLVQQRQRHWERLLVVLADDLKLRSRQANGVSCMHFLWQDGLALEARQGFLGTLKLFMADDHVLI